MPTVAPGLGPASLPQHDRLNHATLRSFKGSVIHIKPRHTHKLTKDMSSQVKRGEDAPLLFPAVDSGSSSGLGSASKPETRRRSSSILQHLRRESITDQNDQISASNLNAEWVNHKGAWLIHIVIIMALLLLFEGIPFVSAEVSWTLTNISYVLGSYVMFHYVTGVPFDFNAGAYDSLTMWEQIDDGDQYTPTKKFLLGVPIGLFLLSTHFAHYDLTLFIINLFFCVLSVLPKLPASHRLRFVLNDEVPPSPTIELTQDRHRRLPSKELKNSLPKDSK